MTKQDYESLDAIGANLTGKIVLTRYGWSFRGLKVSLKLFTQCPGLDISRSKVQRNEVLLEFSYTLTLEMMVMSRLQTVMRLIRTDPLATQHPYNVEVFSIFPYTLETQLRPDIHLTKTQNGRKAQTYRRYLAYLSHGAMDTDSSRPLAMCIWTRRMRQVLACSAAKSARAKLGWSIVVGSIFLRLYGSPRSEKII